MRQVTRKGLMTMAAATGVLAVTGGYAHADASANGSATNSPGVLSGNSVQAPVHVPVNVCGNTVNVVGLLNPAAGNSCANKGGGSHAGGGGAHASGHASNSPGVGSGNNVQVPVHAPVNACGNSVNVVGLLNPAVGNDCVNGSHNGGGGSHAGGHTSGSPGVGSGNNVQVPVDVPVNACGNSVNVIGLGNPAAGNDCANTGGGHSTTPPGGGHETPPGGGGGTTPPGGGGGTTPPGGGGGTTPPGTPGHPGTPQHPGGGGSHHINHPGVNSVTQPSGAAQLAHTGSDLSLGVLVPAGAGALLGGALLYRRARAHA
ncbi:chaplin [Streptomyces yaanensis]|uniref:Chaplin n=1 Tax=Streptomyces yaanensis TaxID=1142239 RepID=A0ABV7SMU1_9ACTN|nr:chaplin [Streptomyces sp. CGMCC 4.7035]WNC00859.1 chaplin [Streptomyces sp. CGMCC 4.7035]